MTPIEIGFLSGIMWALVVLVWSLAEITSKKPSQWLLLMIFIYQGFDLTPKGIITGGLWAFADGFISGYAISSIFQWLF